MDNAINALLEQAEMYEHRRAFGDSRIQASFEPDMMEHPEQYRGEYDKESGILTLCFEVKGTRYEGRTERLEYVSVGERLTVRRDAENKYNSNNFLLDGVREENLGTLPAELCNGLAPLYDNGTAEVICCKVSYLEPITKRSRYAKQAILFVELKIRLVFDKTTDMSNPNNTCSLSFV